MGRGLGTSQRRILAMADFNRIADGVESAQWSLSFVSKPDRDIVGGLFDSLNYIYEKIKKLDYETRDRLSGDFGLLGVLTIIDESGLIDRDWQCFGTWHDYMRLCHNRIHEINEKLDAAGLELLDDQAFHPPEPDGRFIRSYKEFPSLALAQEYRSRMSEAGFDVGDLAVFKSGGRENCHLSFVEILADLYGFRPFLLGRKDSRRLHAGGIEFDRRAIGLARYNSALAAASKALVTLEIRNLIHWSERGGKSRSNRYRDLQLTPEGIEEAERIRAKNPDAIRDLGHYAEGPERLAVAELPRMATTSGVPSSATAISPVLS